jgi:hypothetical protein
LLIGGRGPGGKFLSGTKKVIIRWSFLELGSYGNIGISFADWWKRSWRKIPKRHKKGYNSLVILGAWILWKHRNALSCIFEESAPKLQYALYDELHLWQAAGAKGLRALGLGQVV